MKKVYIYTDGACSGNPGPGGYGTILKYNQHIKELSEGYKLTTNNRMELLAVIKGLEALKEPCEVTIYSDSKYIVDAINQKWVYKWKNQGWMRNSKEKALNSDLWERLLQLMEPHKTQFLWVKGHSGHPENERCDFLATEAIKKPHLLDDEEFMKERSVEDGLF
ncbi:RNase HI [Anaerobranca californiensis DSM 14826]|jgi:ribonuclease HI|uniref:Ribonuclease H n=1 Tax=Anaerobranca californiensis DSM 14826 TaxID=1120989 RepID=A0A1M6N816_9FIRM|nr:ribonuclease HI [Anaerobranca californiensis]SHJ91784.1 RNase HI [Anaerobranca californiensis DSM 14826]